MDNPVQFNSLKTRSDFENAALQILEPFSKSFRPALQGFIFTKLLCLHDDSYSAATCRILFHYNLLVDFLLEFRYVRYDADQPVAVCQAA